MRLVHGDGGGSWLTSGQTLTEAGVTVQGDSSQAIPAAPASSPPAPSAPAENPAPEPPQQERSQDDTLDAACGAPPSQAPFFVAREPDLGGPLRLMRGAVPGE